MMSEIFRRHGLERMECQDKQFDPRFHEVLDTVNQPEEPEMKIVSVYKDGYLFDGKLLRPSLVRVVKHEAARTPHHR